MDAKLDKAKDISEQARVDSKTELNERSGPPRLRTIRESGESQEPRPPIVVPPPPGWRNGGPRQSNRQLRDTPDVPPRNPARLQQVRAGNGGRQPGTGSPAPSTMVNAPGTNPGLGALGAIDQLSRGVSRGSPSRRPRTTAENSANGRRGNGRESVGVSPPIVTITAPEASEPQDVAPADGQPGPSSTEALAADDEFTT